MFVSASTECFPHLRGKESLQQLVDLEFSCVELALHEQNGWLKPSDVLADLDRTIQTCRDTHRLEVTSLSIDIEADGDDYYRQVRRLLQAGQGH